MKVYRVLTFVYTGQTQIHPRKHTYKRDTHLRIYGHNFPVYTLSRSGLNFPSGKWVVCGAALEFIVTLLKPRVVVPWMAGQGGGGGGSIAEFEASHSVYWSNLIQSFLVCISQHKLPATSKVRNIVITANILVNGTARQLHGNSGKWEETTPSDSRDMWTGSFFETLTMCVSVITPYHSILKQTLERAVHDMEFIEQCGSLLQFVFISVISTLYTLN
jgi:hypothetical protein